MTSTAGNRIHRSNSSITLVMVADIYRYIAVKDRTESYPYLKVARIQKDLRKTMPHRHNKYIEFIFLLQGGGSHTIDNMTYVVNPPVWFTIRSEQIHYLTLNKEPEGYVLTLKKQFIETSIDKALKKLLARINQY